MSSPLAACEMYANAHGHKLEGDDACHWCGSPCKRLWKHDDPPPDIGARRSQALRPANGFICQACWLFRRASVTVSFLGGGFLDRQAAKDHSWLITRHACWGLRLTDAKPLTEFLLKPRLAFVLAIAEGQENYIQHWRANDLPEIKNNTPLHFTLNGKPLTYTVYELEHALKTGPEGKEPGVQALLRLFPVDKPRMASEDIALSANKVEEGKGAGRPKKEETDNPKILHKTVRK